MGVKLALRLIDAVFTDLQRRLVKTTSKLRRGEAQVRRNKRIEDELIELRAKNIELEKRLEPCRREETGAEGNQDILSCSTLVDLINQPEEYAQKVEKKGREEKIGRVERIGRVGKVGRIEGIGRVEQIGQIGEVGRIGEVGQIVEIGQIGQVGKIQWAKDENHEEQRRKRKRAEDTNLLKKRGRPSQKIDLGPVSKTELLVPETMPVNPTSAIPDSRNTKIPDTPEKSSLTLFRAPGEGDPTLTTPEKSKPNLIKTNLCLMMDTKEKEEKVQLAPSSPIIFSAKNLPVKFKPNGKPYKLHRVHHGQKTAEKRMVGEGKPGADENKELCSGDRVASRPSVSDAFRPTSSDASGPTSRDASGPTASEPSRPQASKASRPKPSVLFGPMDTCEPITSQQKYLDFELKRTVGMISPKQQKEIDRQTWKQINEDFAQNQLNKGLNLSPSKLNDSDFESPNLLKIRPVRARPDVAESEEDDISVFCSPPEPLPKPKPKPERRISKAQPKMKKSENRWGIQVEEITASQKKRLKNQKQSKIDMFLANAQTKANVRLRGTDLEKALKLSKEEYERNLIKGSETAENENNSKELLEDPITTTTTEDLAVDVKDGRENKDPQLNFAYVGPSVRKREDRAKLKGFSCAECEEYYNMKRDEGLSEEQIASLMNDCSKHRALYRPPLTPEKFWDPEIIEDPESPRNKTQTGAPLRTRAVRRAEKRNKLRREKAREENDDYTI
ncbi:DNA endonuclease RBBP8 isoform X3 [Eurytemora carolleeae]|nr:DNA endonuclease RBBP8 isoform X3 [Eurytemora carolleeae]|eukprot:XP_023342878.1 DNA endonuclease RBBP8-like isoform X3 [Eurytemora affinis]